MILYDKLKDVKYIPLSDYTKIANVKWGTDNDLKLKDNQISFAIDTGRSNLVVIDCDNKNGLDGVGKFLSHSMELDEIPQTFTVETPNDGLHFYFKAPSNLSIKSSVGTLLGDGIDVRANGGYVVAPGSKYKLDDGSVAEYKVEDPEVEIAELPNWIINQIKQNEVVSKNKNEKEKLNNNNHDSISEKEELDRKAAFDWAKEKMNQAQIGQRQSVLNNVSFFMGRKRVNENTARELINIAISIGLSEKEAESTFNHGYQDGIKAEEQTYDVMIKSYNAQNNISIKEDPLDTGFYTHVSLSYNFWKENNHKFLYYLDTLSWYEYNDSKGCWTVIDEQVIKTTVKEFLEELVSEIRETNKNIRPNVYTLQEKLWAKSTIEAVTSVAKSDFTNRSENLFDEDPYLINLSNGVYDVKNNKLLNHSPNYFITKYIPVQYNPDASDKYCDAIIDSLHPEEKDYVQLIVGQSLLGHQPDYQAAYFMHGRGSNGKSTFVDLLLKTSGSYAKLQPPNIFSPEKSGDVYALSDFEGLRSAIIEELPDSKHLNSGALKRLVGTKRINARAIYKNNREFENQSTIFITCNRLPMINETDDGTWRRLLVFSFPYSYKKKASEVKSEYDRIGNPRVIYAAQNKKSTAEAFLKWRIEGARKWVENSKIEYDIPSHIEEVVNEWNENNDLFLAWANEKLEFNVTNSFVTILDLNASFNEWTQTRNNAAVSLRFFSETIRNHKIYYNNNLSYRNRARVLKGMVQSRFVNSSGYESKTYDEGSQCSYITGVKFK